MMFMMFWKEDLRYQCESFETCGVTGGTTVRLSESLFALCAHEHEDNDISSGGVGGRTLGKQEVL